MSSSGAAATSTTKPVATNGGQPADSKLPSLTVAEEEQLMLPEGFCGTCSAILIELDDGSLIANKVGPSLFLALYVGILTAVDDEEGTGLPQGAGRHV
jgi:hypothetical protein